MNAITMIWNRVSETGLPKTELNTDTEFIVAVHRRAQDRIDRFAASFLNAKQLYSADELGEIAHDEGTKPVTGWYILTADDPNQDACWWNIIDDGSGDAVVAWMAMPPEPIFFVGSKGRCTVCNDTGRSILPNGDQSTYLDCRHCGAAEERVSMNEAVGAFAMINRDDMDCDWFIHQRARQIEREASATRIAELEAQIADWAGLVGGKDGEIYSLRQQLAVASAHQADNTDKLREAILNTEVATSGSKGYAKAWNEGAEHMRDAILNLVEVTALQAPVREVPGWKLVPLKLTQEMSRAGVKLRMSHNTSIDGVYAAMLAAAPLPAAPVQEPKP